MRKLIVLLVAIVVVAGGCTIRYTMGGANTGVARTFSVSYFANNAEIVVPTLSRTITEALKDKFISDTKLGLVSTDGDLHFEGYIEEYSTAPIAIQENDVAAKNRLTISLKVTFTNKKDDKFDFENTSFRRFADYDSNQQLSAVEEQLIKQIVEELMEDIFNKSVVNW